MPQTYVYNSPATIKNYGCLRRTTLWAGTLGVVQAIIWIALTIVGIIAYNCIIDYHNNFNFGSLMQYIFYDLYFRGSCKPNVYDEYNNTVLLLAQKETILDPTQILVWDSVYLAGAVCWLCSSIILITNLKKDQPKTAIYIIFTWVSITLCICLMDLALGIIFGIDYGRLHLKAYDLNLHTAHAGLVDAQNVQWFAAMVASISMMILSLKGFILWLINFGLVVYLFLKAKAIIGDMDNNNTLYMPRKQSDEVLTSQPPISAYDDIKYVPNSYMNEAFVPDNRSQGTVELNQAPIARAARTSTDPSLQDRRFRNINVYEQYPPVQNDRESAQKRSEPISPTPIVPVSAFPAPDYSPIMPRAMQQGQTENGGVRKSRF